MVAAPVVTAEWDYWAHAPVDAPHRQVLRDWVHPIRDARLLEVIDVPAATAPGTGVEVAPGVRLFATPGHTPGQVAVELCGTDRAPSSPANPPPSRSPAPAPPAAWTPTPPRPYAAAAPCRPPLCDTGALAPAHHLRRRPPAPSHPRPAPTIWRPRPHPQPPTRQGTSPTPSASGRGPPGVEADHRARRRTTSARTDRAAGAGRRRRPGDDGARQVRVPSPHNGRSVRM
ncbi:hypothetical protein E4K10_43845 [Streptomyces sp. T1317-0309]|nr:hypothetical protein E4K10_43845 [Streptomyces sp. T1317-0309]